MNIARITAYHKSIHLQLASCQADTSSETAARQYPPHPANHLQGTTVPATLRLCPSLILDDQGSNLIEYALVAALLALCAVSSTSRITCIVQNTFNNVANGIANTV
jgi:Flp pilus assembly pilin Flp